jgi:hypothetical protein
MDHQQDAYHHAELLNRLQNLDFDPGDSGNCSAFVVQSSLELAQCCRGRINVRERSADLRDQLRIAQT